MFLLTVNKVFTASGYLERHHRSPLQAAPQSVIFKHILQKIKRVIHRFNDSIRVNANFPHALTGATFSV